MSLPPDRRQRVDEICDAALGLPAGEREAFLREACRGDEGIQREVEALLAGVALASVLGCSATRVEHATCKTNHECRETFGFGAT